MARPSRPSIRRLSPTASAATATSPAGAGCSIASRPMSRPDLKETPHDYALRFQVGARLRPRPGPRPARPLGAGGGRHSLRHQAARPGRQGRARLLDVIQPWGQVPAIEDAGLVLFESAAIVQYLADRS